MRRRDVLRCERDVGVHYIYVGRLLSTESVVRVKDDCVGGHSVY